MTEIVVYLENIRQADQPTLYEGDVPSVPAVGDTISWDDPKFEHSKEPMTWKVERRHYTMVADVGTYVTLFVSRLT